MSRLLKESRPDLAREWHPRLNPTLSLDTITDDSELKVHWLCAKNHEWEAPVRRRVQSNSGCPYCKGPRLDPARSLAALYPHLAAEWNTSKNGGRDPSRVSPSSIKYAWWKCDKGHEWRAGIYSRVFDKRPCPKCRIADNSLVVTHPILAAEWHPTRNSPLLPIDVSHGMRKKAWWKCQLGHEWNAQISTRARLDSKCPICQAKEQRSSPLSLAMAFPLIAGQWHPSKNGQLTPNDVPGNSSRKVWWLCPSDFSHEWPAIIRNRTALKSGCPFCKNTKVTKENSLATKFPTIAADWHPQKNGPLRPDNIHAGSSKKVWWKCSRNPAHEWKTTVTRRTQGGIPRGCPYCSGQLVSPENSLSVTNPDIAAEWHPVKNGTLAPSGVTRASGKKVWWKCSRNPAHEWPTQVKNRTVLKTGCPFCDAEDKTIRIRESLWDSKNEKPDTFSLYRHAIHNIQRLGDIICPPNSHLDQTQRRLHYSAVVTALEAYLYSTFRKIVFSDDSLLAKLIQTAPEFADRRWAISDVLDWQKNFKDRVSEYLFNISWHNLPKVRNMYRDTLCIEFPAKFDRLMSAVAIRHDIVHRNGHKKNGGPRFLPKRAVEYLITDVNALVDHIELRIKEKYPACMSQAIKSPKIGKPKPMSVPATN